MAGKASGTSKPMWLRYDLELHFTGRLCGSVPQSEELIRPWLESRAPKEKPAEGPSLDELQQEVAASLPDDEEQAPDEKIQRITLGFQRDAEEGTLFVRAATLRAHIKDCANQIKDLIGHPGFKAHVANKVYVMPDTLFLYRLDGTPISTHDGEYDQAVHVQTRQGPRSALKRIRYVERPVVSCTLLLLNDGKVQEDELRAILDYGSIHGYGGERSMGEGRYLYDLIPEGARDQQEEKAS